MPNSKNCEPNSPAASIAFLARQGRLDLPPRLLARLLDDWRQWARADQWHPPGNWTTWLMIGGRGAGKTRAGAEWIKALALGDRSVTQAPLGRIALVGETAQDVRDVMVEGVSGILAVHRPDERPFWEPSRRRLTWRNGAVAQCFSAEDPESLRGPQFGAAWCDEIAKWKQDEAAFDMLQFGLRLGAHPRQLLTTTPRPTALLKRLMDAERTVVTHASTRANSANLSPDFLDAIVARYEGTRLGRQEIDGEFVEDLPGALWTRAMLESARVAETPALSRIVVAVDPPASSGRRADACGIVAAGQTEEGRFFVLADETCERARPAVWAAAAAALFHRLEADMLVAEVNQGGEMVASVLAEADSSVPVMQVRATRGKYLRAAPVAQLYEQGRVWHAGCFPALEDEMCAMTPDRSANSPDRLDALVWAITALMQPRPRGAPRMRSL